jgi:hypothetical protein
MEGILMKKICAFILSLAMLIPLVIAVPVLAAPNENAMHTVSVVQLSNTSVKYGELTTACLGWGLSENPYPSYLPLATGVKGTLFNIFTVQIGDDIFDGISCNTYSEALTNYRPIMQGGQRIGWLMDVVRTYDATWYLGDFGKDNARMNSGFSGTVVVTIYDFSTVSGAYTYYSGVFNLEGFQCFNHQSMHLTIPDSRVSLLGTGYCDVLGNRDKM